MNKPQQILSDITVFQKYAKYIKEIGRRETWEEICQRNMAMHMNKYPMLKDDIRESYKYVLDKKILPSMRSMQFAGLPIELSNNRIFNCAYAAVDHPAIFSEAMFLLLGGTGFGYSVQKQHVEKLPTIVGPNDKNRRFLIGDSIEGWADSIKVLVKAYTQGKSKPIFDFRDIRQKGAALVTSGGKAPGPDPLKLCLTQLEIIFNNAIGRKLTTLECHDIMCYIADAVLTGGIRRAALISLFSKDDMDMLSAKSGSWWELNPQRGRANNSVVLHRDEISEEDFKEIWQKVEMSGSGEPGIFWTNDYDIGTNPCVSGDAIITVCDHGINGGLGLPYNIPLKMLVEMCNSTDLLPCVKSYNTDLNCYEWKQIEDASLTKKQASLVKVSFNGNSVKCTPDHKIYTTNRGWVEAQNLEPDDVLVI